MDTRAEEYRAGIRRGRSALGAAKCAESDIWSAVGHHQALQQSRS